MTEPEIPNFKPIVTILFIAIGTAVAVTIIDWKIKNDILNSARDFYLAIGKEIPDGKGQQGVEHSGPRNLLRVPMVDPHSRMEARVSAEPDPFPSRFAVPDSDGESDTGTDDNSAAVSEESVGVEG